MFIFRHPLAALTVALEGEGGSGGSGRDPVPYDRFQRVNDQRGQAERERDEAARERDKLREQLTAREREGMPELSKVQAELADAVRERDEARQQLEQASTLATNLERGGWVRAAAQAAKFHDPEDAIARINLSELKTADAAKREVEALAKNAGHLVQPEPEPEPEPTGGDLLQRTLDRGRPVEDPAGTGGGNTDAGKGPVLPADTFNSLNQDQLVQLQEADPGLYERSLQAAAAA